MTQSAVETSAGLRTEYPFVLPRGYVDEQVVAKLKEWTFKPQVEPVKFMESSDKEIIMKQLPGSTTPGKIVLKRGKNSSMELWAWHESVLNGDIVAARKSASLVMYNYDGKAVARYHLEHAWPSKIEIGALKAGSSEVLMETVTIVCERIQRVAP